MPERTAVGDGARGSQRVGQIATVIETESPWSAELRKSVEIT